MNKYFDSNNGINLNSKPMKTRTFAQDIFLGTIRFKADYYFCLAGNLCLAGTLCLPDTLYQALFA